MFNILFYFLICLNVFDRVVKKNKEKKQKERQDKKASDKPNKLQNIDRKHLHNYRVVQRNLVYIIGVPSTIATEETLRRPEYFGQYGRIAKVVVHRNHSSSHSTVSAYITFTYKDDARAAIQALEGFWLDGHQMRASFGTTKYCNNFIRGVPCNNPECVYLHELGEDEDRFTKEEIQVYYIVSIQEFGLFLLNIYLLGWLQQIITTTWKRSSISYWRWRPKWYRKTYEQ